MPNEKANDKYKDALFRIIFGDYKENALSLYNAINGTEYTDVDDLKVTTLKDALYISIKNDVSFLFNNEMNLYEHQSSYCPNMPLRGLGYFADLYQILLGGKRIARKRIYSSTKVMIPAPRYYVFYNGSDIRPDREELLFSSLYEGEGDIEITAHMINVNAGHNGELLERCKPLSDYSEFVRRLREEIQNFDDKEEAIRKTIESCIKDGILAEILEKEYSRIMNSLLKGFTEKELEEIHKIELEESRKEGRTEGQQEARYEDVDRLVEDGVYDIEKACAVLRVELETYKEYLARK